MLRVDHDGPVWRMTLARPEVRNALNDELIEALISAFDQLPQTARVVILAGEPPSFCAGGDLEWMRKAAGYTEEQNYHDALRIAGLFQAIASCPAVVISAVRGHCFGGGCGLVAASDVGIGATDALFAFSEVKLGLVPATISPVVIEKIGRGHARALFATGETFDAARALQVGLLNDVLEPDALEAAVENRVKAVLRAGPEAVTSSKQITRSPLMSSEQSARLLASTRAGAEAQEGIAAFLEKRSASFVVKR